MIRCGVSESICDDCKFGVGHLLTELYRALLISSEKFADICAKPPEQECSKIIPHSQLIITHVQVIFHVLAVIAHFPQAGLNITV